MRNTESPGKSDFEMWANAYDHWDWSEDGTVLRITTVISNSKINQEKNDSIHGRRLTDLEAFDISLQDPPDLPEDFCEEVVKHDQNGEERSNENVMGIYSSERHL